MYLSGRRYAGVWNPSRAALSLVPLASLASTVCSRHQHCSVAGRSILRPLVVMMTKTGSRRDNRERPCTSDLLQDLRTRNTAYLLGMHTKWIMSTIHNPGACLLVKV
jgi:hypothetical protein